MAHNAPAICHPDGLTQRISKALGKQLLAQRDAHDEVHIIVARASIADVLTILRDDFAYQQLMEIAGADYPERAERFDIAYCLLSVTANHRLTVHVTTDADHAVPSVCAVYPSAGWLEREVFDLYGVIFDGHGDLRRILTDYGFAGHPLRKDFPLTGYVELRYSEAEKRVVYEPVLLAQDFRSFDFMSPWEGAQYVLPGDEKAPAPPAPPPAAAPTAPPPAADKPVKAVKPKTAAKPKAAKPAAKKTKG